MISTALYMLMSLICSISKDIEGIEKKHRENLNKIEQWTIQIGFKFPITKTECIEHRILLHYFLTIYGSQFQ